MKLKRILASVLVLAMSISLYLPVGAANSSFSDINDTETAMNADVLRLLDVVSGTGSNQFKPNATLTRGEFCAMVVSFMGIKDDAVLHTTRTIFKDVPSSHWAAGYINLAASTTISTGSDTATRLISGVGDGTFRPNDNITYAQAVTILLRVLGYDDTQSGGVWPMGYLNLAKSLDMTEGMSHSPSTPLTRQSAAQLFVQALSTETPDKTLYYAQRADTVQENVIIVATNVTDSDGKTGAIRTSHGTYLPENRGVNPTGLQGQRGIMLLNSQGEIITFLPDDSTAIKLTLSGDAEATYLKGTNGKRYNISASTPTFTSGSETVDSTYDKIWTSLKSGTQVTLFMKDGLVVGLFAGLTTTTSDKAMVMTETPSRDQFYAMTGGSSDFGILKNSVEISVSDIKANDVVTYDPLNNTLIVSDLRLTAVYESAYPNSSTPTTITALGHDFPVLDSALEASDSIGRGNMVTFLLTGAGEIAAIKRPDSRVRSTMTGIAGANSVVVTLPSGEEITLSSQSDLSDSVQGKLVTVSSSFAGSIHASSLSGGSNVDFDVKDMMMGDRTISPSVALYEQVTGGAVTKLSISALNMDTIKARDIAAYRYDSSGIVDIIILDGVTGDSYTYGKLIETPKSETGSNRHVSVENSGTGSSAEISGLIWSKDFKDGAFGGATIGLDGKASSVVVLESIDNISRGDFFTVDGKNYITADGKSYLVSDEVECYNEDNKSWTTFNAIRAYSNDLTIYIDPLGEKVRVISAAE